MSLRAMKKTIRDVPDFPKPGIIFKDITPVLADPKLFKEITNLFARRYKGQAISKIAAVDARGFIFGAALAYKMGLGFVPIRKKGKLPYQCIEESYQLEYGSATLCLHVDALKPGEKVVLIDDLLATGGTALACANMIRKLGADLVEVAFVIELAFLKGREKLKDFPVFAPIVF